MLNNKKGVAFFLVFLIIGFVSALFIAVSIQVQNQAHMVKVGLEKEKAFLIAQAGLDAVYYEEQKTNWSWFTHKPDGAGGYELPETAPDPTIVLYGKLPLIDGALPDGSYENGASGSYADDIMDGRFEVTAKQDLNDDKIITIESTGTYGSQSVTLASTYHRALFNKYFIYTPYRLIYNVYNWNLNAGRGKIYVGQDFGLSSHYLCQGNISGTGNVTVLGRIMEWTWEDGDLSSDIEYRLSRPGATQKSVRTYFLGLDDTPYGNPLDPSSPSPWVPPGFNYGDVYINGVPLRVDPLMKGAYSDISSYTPPAWLNKVSPSQNETYGHILAYDDGADLSDDSDDELIPVIPGQLPATILNDLNQRKSDRATAWQNFMAAYNAAGYNNIIVGAGVNPVTSPNYDLLTDSAIIHIVDPIDDPNIAGDDIVSDLMDIPGAVAIINFYDAALCYQEDNWLGYTQEVRDAYKAVYPAVNTDDPTWQSYHDGSIVGGPIRTVVIDVEKMVVDESLGGIPDRTVVHSEVPVILLGTPDVAKTFTFICDDNLYLQGNFNNVSHKSISLMSRTSGFYQSDTFIVTKDPFQINSFYAKPALGTYLDLIPNAGLPLEDRLLILLPRGSYPRIDAIPKAVPTTQNALFIGIWNYSRENWCIGNVPLTQKGSMIRLPSSEFYPSPYPFVRTSSREYGAMTQFLYSGNCINRIQEYDDNFYDNPAAGHIAGSQLIEWSIVR